MSNAAIPTAVIVAIRDVQPLVTLPTFTQRATLTKGVADIELTRELPHW
jgi:hypothetical protein